MDEHHFVNNLFKHIVAFELTMSLGNSNNIFDHVAGDSFISNFGALTSFQENHEHTSVTLFFEDETKIALSPKHSHCTVFRHPSVDPLVTVERFQKTLNLLLEKDLGLNYLSFELKTFKIYDSNVIKGKIFDSRFIGVLGARHEFPRTSIQSSGATLTAFLDSIYDNRIDGPQYGFQYFLAPVILVNYRYLLEDGALNRIQHKSLINDWLKPLAKASVSWLEQIIDYAPGNPA